ncbi:MAG: flagellar basal-body rod protein FlgF [Kangiellaceae bacterium]|nr:flagellar basal-body rod protein FlgF [Kangiellaceae bacterium]MCW9016910.1 flagellar basal-body rod protein FlgF [Kangiellaceae bacterium]
MQQAFFTGLSGLLTFSRTLDTISNNIANMNTSGFRGNDVFYKALSSGGTGIGPSLAGTSTRMTAGEIRQTGSTTDLAISGQGYFILQGEHGNFYTRAGNFQFNDEGLLVDIATGYRVQALNDAGMLTDISVNGLETLAPEATTEISFGGNLSIGDSDHTLSDIIAYNTEGEAINLNFEFTNNTGNVTGSWLVEVTDEDGNVIGNGEIRFNPDSTPQAGFETFDITLPGATGDVVTLNFGTANTPDGATSTSGASTQIGATVEDGFPLSGLIGVSFDTKGQLQLLYSNGDTHDGPQIALAHFTNEQDLQQIDGAYFKAQENNQPTIGHADENLFGQVVGSSLELSNVDLAKEFADMIIVQRGYQASSRAMNIANQLVEQLYESTRG